MAKKKTEDRELSTVGPTERREGYVPRLKQQYQGEVVARLMKEFGIENPMAVPRLEKISLNMGMGEAIQNV